jgi:glycosyltransferase involved in cell wall biosynthesis
MPVYNVERFVADAVRSVLAQSFEDFELLIIDDLSPDGSIAVCQGFDDPRIRIIHHRQNRGLAGARNTGVRNAQGDLLAFIDSDDCWHPEKLERHVAHLNEHPGVGVSFSRSAFIDEDGIPNNCYQMPRLTALDPGYYLCRNPIGNGSAPVIRREVFRDIRYFEDSRGKQEDWYFDERLRRSEDIECWIRIALTTHWVIEGIPEPLTLYRLNAGGLSACLLKQLESWEQVIEKTRGYAPEFIAAWERTARAYQLRYLARQAIRLHDGKMAVQLVHRALRTDPAILLNEPGRSIITIGAAWLLRLSPRRVYKVLEEIAQRLIGTVQARRIDLDVGSRVS